MQTMTIYRTVIEQGDDPDTFAERLNAGGARNVTTYEQGDATYAEWTGPSMDTLIDTASVGVWAADGTGALLDAVTEGARIIDLDVIECPADPA